MCDPLSIAGLAFTVGSSFLSAQSAAKVEKARNRAQVAEIRRQTDLQRQSAESVAKTQQEFTKEKVNEGIDKATEERTERLRSSVTGGGDQTGGDIPTEGSAPTIVRETAGRELARGLARGKEFAGQLGALGAFNENQFNQGISLARLGERTQRFAQDSANSAAILPHELQAANQKGKSLAGFADALGAIGSVANIVGATGGINTGKTGTSPLPDIFRGTPPVPVRNPRPVIPAGVL